MPLPFARSATAIAVAACGPGKRDAPALPDNCMNSYWSFASFQALVAGDGSISIPSASVRATVSVAGRWVRDPEYAEHGN